MRKLIVTNIMSVDGYYEGPGANVMALPMDHRFDTYNAERLRAADTLLLGRRTYELFKEIAALKQQAGRDIQVFGSRTLWNDLLAAGLVDELHLIVGGVVLGGGTPMFGAAPARTLALLDVRTWDDSSNALLRYTTWGCDDA